jgi:hypothetical protein
LNYVIKLILLAQLLRLVSLACWSFSANARRVPYLQVFTTIANSTVGKRKINLLFNAFVLFLALFQPTKQLQQGQKPPPLGHLTNGSTSTDMKKCTGTP